jgi:DNA-binding transcriptional MerR regulator
MSQNPDTTKSQPRYKIGAVSNITGLTTHSIRAWENRYKLKLAQRSEGNTRLYTDQDIVLLSLLRELINRGDSIGEIAGLSEKELRERLKHYEPIPRPALEAKASLYKESKADSGQSIRAMVLGDTLSEYFENVDSSDLPCQVQRKASTAEDALAYLESEDTDILLAHIKAMGADPIGFLEEWNQKMNYAPTIVFYDLINSVLFSELVKLGAKLVKWPVDLVILSQKVTDYYRLHRLKRRNALGKEIRVEEPSDDLKRLFSDAQLMKLCQDSTRIGCDYLRNIVSLLFEIDSLENYFNDLASRLEGDQAFHLELSEKTTRARALIESMLTAACAHEKLDSKTTAE